MQQLFGNALEALRLTADVSHKLTHCGLVNLLGLQNGIREQPDGCQGRLQLVGRIRHKTAAGIFRHLQPVCQTVKLPCQSSDLVVPSHGGTVIVVAPAHNADG